MLGIFPLGIAIGNRSFRKPSRRARLFPFSVDNAITVRRTCADSAHDVYHDGNRQGTGTKGHDRKIVWQPATCPELKRHGN